MLRGRGHGLWSADAKLRGGCRLQAQEPANWERSQGRGRGRGRGPHQAAEQIAFGGNASGTSGLSLYLL